VQHHGSLFASRDALLLLGGPNTGGEDQSINPSKSSKSHTSTREATSRKVDFGGPNTGGVHLGGPNTGGANLGRPNTGGVNFGGTNTGGVNPSLFSPPHGRELGRGSFPYRRLLRSSDGSFCIALATDPANNKSLLQVSVECIYI